MSASTCQPRWHISPVNSCSRPRSGWTGDSTWSNGPRCPGEATSPPGNSRNCWPTTCAASSASSGDFWKKKRHTCDMCRFRSRAMKALPMKPGLQLAQIGLRIAVVPTHVILVEDGPSDAEAHRQQRQGHCAEAAPQLGACGALVVKRAETDPGVLHTRRANRERKEKRVVKQSDQSQQANAENLCCLAFRRMAELVRGQESCAHEAGQDQCTVNRGSHETQAHGRHGKRRGRLVDGGR